MRGHHEATRHSTAVGLNWGLAAGAVAALFPAVGILAALAVGGGAGAALGALAGHAGDGLTRGNLMALGEVLGEGAAGLVVVYASDMADRVAAGVTAARRTVRATTTVTAEQLAERIRAASP